MFCSVAVNKTMCFAKLRVKITICQMIRQNSALLGIQIFSKPESISNRMIMKIFGKFNEFFVCPSSCLFQTSIFFFDELIQ